MRLIVAGFRDILDAAFIARWAAVLTLLAWTPDALAQEPPSQELPPVTVTAERPIVCVGTGGPSVLVEVRGPDDEPAAYGASIIIRDGAFVDSTGGPVWPRYLGAGNRRPGTYEVTVTKPGYEPVVLTGVEAPPTGSPVCHYSEPAGPQRVVHLRLLPDARPVRSVYVGDGGMGFGLPYLQAQLSAVVDAAPGVSQAVRWASSDTTLVTVTEDGVVRSECTPTGGRL